MKSKTYTKANIDITYHKNLRDVISSFSKKFKALIQHMIYHQDICDDFPNSQVCLTPKGVSYIAYSMDFRYCFMTKE